MSPFTYMPMLNICTMYLFYVCMSMCATGVVALCCQFAFQLHLDLNAMARHQPARLHRTTRVAHSRTDTIGQGFQGDIRLKPCRGKRCSQREVTSCSRVEQETRREQRTSLPRFDDGSFLPLRRFDRWVAILIASQQPRLSVFPASCCVRSLFTLR